MLCINSDKISYGSGKYCNTLESKITLGLSKDSVISIKGSPFTVKKISKTVDVFCYKIDGGKYPKVVGGNSAFLRKYNENEYTAEFYFRNDTLIMYNFGFVYN